MKMKIFILSFCGFCIFYICNADWIDELIEDYLGNDYEEVAPFISSVTAGTEEFDQLAEELHRSKCKWFSSFFTLLLLFGVVVFSVLLYEYAFLFRGRRIVKAAAQFLAHCFCFRNSTDSNKEEIQNLVTEFLEKKLRHFYRSKGDDIPVKLLWKGGTLVESTMHCNVKNDSKIHQALLQSKLSFKVPERGNKKVELSSSASGDLTAQKMADIRKLLDSEQEIIHKFVDKGAGTDDETFETPRNGTAEWQSTTLCRFQGGGKEENPSILQFPEQPSEIVQERSKYKHKISPIEKTANSENLSHIGEPKFVDNEGLDQDGFQDPKLMNRIRLLESRLRLEELKNKNWINRMSRAEGILQQLNKQVHKACKPLNEISGSHSFRTFSRCLFNSALLANALDVVKKARCVDFILVSFMINLDRLTEELIPCRKELTQAYSQVERIEGTRPMETLTETLKITSTVTNWAPTSHPRRNMQFTLVNQSPTCYLQSPYTSLSEIIKREIGISSSGDFAKTLPQIPSTPPIPALPGPSFLPLSSFLSKFFSR